MMKLISWGLAILNMVLEVLRLFGLVEPMPGVDYLARGLIWGAIAQLKI